MRIVVVGGGSGGHVTPALAILEELAKQDKQLVVCFVCDRKFAPQAKTILASSSLPIQFQTVHAGKFRRYHGVSLWRQLLDVKTVLLNIRDIFSTLIGILQSWRILRQFKPDVVFGKGGFVCMPVGIAAHYAGIPLVLHDSDVHPGLTNRILAPWAVAIATGAPLENYNYDPAKSNFVGIPVGVQFTPATQEVQTQSRQKIMTDPRRILVAVVGGGLGAKPINDAMVKSAPTLLAQNIEIVHVTGKLHGQVVAQQLQQMLLQADHQQAQDFYHIEPFVDSNQMADILKAADIVVSRGGATAMAELAALHKAVILVPSPRLTGGQQLKNAKSFAEAGAVVMADDTALQKDYTILQQAIIELADNATRRQTLTVKIAAFAKPTAALETAKMIALAVQKAHKRAA